MPAAVTSSTTRPSAGSGSGSSRSTSTSGPPNSWIWIARMGHTTSCRPMDFEPTERSRDLQERLTAFMEERILPAEAVYQQQLRESGDPHFEPPVMGELKAEARERGLWNLFHPDPEWGAGLTNGEYAPLAEIMGRSHIASEACNCSAPDTGNMEVLTQFGTPEQQDQWLRPLLDGEIRSAFAMTEPDVASSEERRVGKECRSRWS